MFKKILGNFSLNGARRELSDYLSKVTMGNQEQHGMILAHACLIYAQIIKKLPAAKLVYETKEDLYGKECAELVLQTNSLLRDYYNAGDKENAAGVKLLNETFRCLGHSELTDLGKNIWSYFSISQDDAKMYLENLNQYFLSIGNENMKEKINEAYKYLPFIPKRFEN